MKLIDRLGLLTVILVVEHFDNTTRLVLLGVKGSLERLADHLAVFRLVVQLFINKEVAPCVWLLGSDYVLTILNLANFMVVSHLSLLVVPGLVSSGLIFLFAIAFCMPAVLLTSTTMGLTSTV